MLVQDKDEVLLLHKCIQRLTEIFFHTCTFCCVFRMYMKKSSLLQECYLQLLLLKHFDVISRLMMREKYCEKILIENRFNNDVNNGRKKKIFLNFKYSR